MYSLKVEPIDTSGRPKEELVKAPGAFLNQNMEPLAFLPSMISYIQN